MRSIITSSDTRAIVTRRMTHVDPELSSRNMRSMLGPTQTGSTVTLAPIGPDHLEAYCRWFADPVVARFLARETPPTLQQEQE
jgi:hypothetical protein